jgi:hypothetical protein
MGVCRRRSPCPGNAHTCGCSVVPVWLLLAMATAGTGVRGEGVTARAVVGGTGVAVPFVALDGAGALQVALVSSVGVFGIVTHDAALPADCLTALATLEEPPLWTEPQLWRDANSVTACAPLVVTLASGGCPAPPANGIAADACLAATSAALRLRLPLTALPAAALAVGPDQQLALVGAPAGYTPPGTRRARAALADRVLSSSSAGCVSRVVYNASARVLDVDVCSLGHLLLAVVPRAPPAAEPDSPVAAATVGGVAVWYSSGNTAANVGRAVVVAVITVAALWLCVCCCPCCAGCRARGKCCRLLFGCWQWPCCVSHAALSKGRGDGDAAAYTPLQLALAAPVPPRAAGRRSAGAGVGVEDGPLLAVTVRRP